MTHITKVGLEIPDINDLWCINCKISPLEMQDPIIKSMFHGQVLTCRLIIYSVKCCIASPSIQGVGDSIHVIVSKRFFNSGKLQEHLTNLKIKFTSPEQVHPKIYEACLKYTFTFRLAPSWNLVGKYYLRGSNFITFPKTIDAIEWNIKYNAGNSKIDLKPMKLSLFPFDLQSVGLSPGMIQRFLSEDSISFLKLEFECLWVYVLPKLPKTDQGMLYYEVVFPNNPHQHFTYPQLCLFSKLPGLLLCENLNEVASDFIQVLCTQVKVVCGESLKVGQLYSEPMSLKFSSVLENKSDSFKSIEKLRTSTKNQSSSALLPFKRRNQTQSSNMQTQKTLSVTENSKKKCSLPTRGCSQKKCLKPIDCFSENKYESQVDDEILLDQNVERRFTDDHLDDDDLEDVISYYDLPSMWAENLDEFYNATSDAAIIKEHENYQRYLQKYSLKKLLSVKSSNPPAIKKIEKVQYDLTNLKRKKDAEQTDKPILTNARKFDEDYKKMFVDDLNISDYQGHSLRSNNDQSSNKNFEEIQKEKPEIKGISQNAELNSQLQSRVFKFDMNNTHNKNDIEMDDCKKQTFSTQFAEKSDQFSKYFEERESSRTIYSPNLRFQHLHRSQVSPSDKSVHSKRRESSEERRKKLVNEILEKNGFNLKSFYDSPFVKSIMSDENENTLNNNGDENLDDYDPQFFSSKVTATQVEAMDGLKRNLINNHSKISLTDSPKNILTPPKNKFESIDELSLDQSIFDRYNQSKIPSNEVESNQSMSLKNNYKSENFLDEIPSTTHDSYSAVMENFEKVQDNSMHQKQNNHVDHVDKPISANGKQLEEEYQKMLVDELDVSEYDGQSLFSNLNTFSKNTENVAEIQTQQSEILRCKLDQVPKDCSLTKRSESYVNSICKDDSEMKICKNETSTLSEVINKLNEKKLNLKAIQSNKCSDENNFYNTEYAKTPSNENELIINKNVNCNSKSTSSKTASSQQGSEHGSINNLNKDNLIFNQLKIHSSGTSKSSNNSSKRLKINQNLDSNDKNSNFFDVTPLSTDSPINFEGSINRKLLQARKSPACNSNISAYKVKNAQEFQNFSHLSQITVDFSDKFESSINRKLLQPRKSPVSSFKSMSYEVKNSQESKKSVNKYFEKNSGNSSLNSKFKKFDEQSFQKFNASKSLQANNFFSNEKDFSDKSTVKSANNKNECSIEDIPMTEELTHFSSPDMFDCYDTENSFSLLEKYKSDEKSKFHVQKENDDFMSVLSESSDDSNSNNNI